MGIEGHNYFINWKKKATTYIFIYKTTNFRLNYIFLVNKFNNYLWLCVSGIFNLKCLLIEFVILNLSQIYFFIPENFEYKIIFGIYVLVLRIHNHKGYFVVKKLVWNVYTYLSYLEYKNVFLYFYGILVFTLLKSNKVITYL